MAGRVDYDERQWSVYETGRGLTPDRARFWAGILGRYLRPGAVVLDMGAGTGVYSELLAEALGASVIAVEPSDRMREVAKREHPHARVRYLAGSAEEVPADDASCDAALLSNVIHHVREREGGRQDPHAIRGREQPVGGRVLLRA